MGTLLGGSSSAEKEAAKASREQAEQMRKNAESDRLRAQQAQVAAQQQQEALMARQRAEDAARALMEDTKVQAPEVELALEEPEEEVDPNSGRRRRPRDAFQAPASNTGLNLKL